MFGNSHFERTRELFADQFEAANTGFIYRKNLKGAAIQVTEAERDSLISAFDRRLRYVIWSILPATLLLITFLVVLFPDANSPLARVAMFAGMAAIFAPCLLLYYWAWNAPSRDLQWRSPIGEARTREEVRQITFARMTYGQLALATVGAVVLVWKVSAKEDVFHGWGILWIMFAGLLIVGAAVQALRKWMFERNKATPR